MRRIVLAATVLTACSADDLRAPESRAVVRGALGTVVINEFAAGTTGFIELYNSGSSGVDVSGWQVDDVASAGKAPKALPSGTVIPAKGFLSVLYGGVNTASVDEVRLLDASGNELEARSNGWTGESLANRCFGRSPNGGAWAATELLCSPGKSNASSAGGADADVIVNEFSAGTAGWIELYNAGVVPADLSGWSVDDKEGGTAPKKLTAGTVVGPHGFLLVPYGGINTASVDEVRVLDASGAVKDAISNGYSGQSLGGKCFGRFPDGGAVGSEAAACSGGASNADGGSPSGAAPLVINELRAGASGFIEIYNAGTSDVSLEGWSIDDVAGAGAAPKKLAATILMPKALAWFSYSGINSASADEARLVSPGGVVADSHPNGWTGASIASVCFGRSSDGGPWQSAARPCTPGAANAPGASVINARINEFAPGDGGFVELINIGVSDADLSGWAIDDAAGGGAPATLPNGFVLAPGAVSYWSLGTISATSADQVRLLDPSGKVIDQRKNYVGEDPCPGTCYGRIPDGGDWAPYSILCSGGSHNGSAPHTPCLPGTACDDNTSCTAGSVCSSSCVCGAPVTCDDGNPCTVDTCGDGAPACLALEGQSGVSCGTGFTCDGGECRSATVGPRLIINEISAGPDGWVELANVGKKHAYLARYLLSSSGGGAAVTSGPAGITASLAPGARLVVPYHALAANKLDALLLHRDNEVVETVSNYWSQGSTLGLCVARRPDLTGTFAGTSVACTKGASNGGALTVCAVGGACDDGNACTTGEKFTSTCACQGGTTKDCEDGDVCTSDACDPDHGCSQVPEINFSSCATVKVCIAGVCKAEPACSAPGGTYKGVAFTKTEECTALSFMNKARYSQMNSLPAFARNQIYDCDPVSKSCAAFRTSRWSTVAELLTISNTSPVGTTSLNALKTASKGFVASGSWYDTVANTWTNRTTLDGSFIGLESVFVQSMVGNSCAIIRDAPGATNSLTMCAQLCYSDGPCASIPALGSTVSVRGRLVLAADFSGGPRWILTAATTGKPNPSF